MLVHPSLHLQLYDNTNVSSNSRKTALVQQAEYCILQTEHSLGHPPVATRSSGYVKRRDKICKLCPLSWLSEARSQLYKMLFWPPPAATYYTTARSLSTLWPQLSAPAKVLLVHFSNKVLTQSQLFWMSRTRSTHHRKVLLGERRKRFCTQHCQ